MFSSMAIERVKCVEWFFLVVHIFVSVSNTKIKTKKIGKGVMICEIGTYFQSERAILLLQRCLRAIISQHGMGAGHIILLT